MAAGQLISDQVERAPMKPNDASVTPVRRDRTTVDRR
jgi:hypothetical protein